MMAKIFTLYHLLARMMANQLTSEDMDKAIGWLPLVCEDDDTAMYLIPLVYELLLQSIL